MNDAIDLTAKALFWASGIPAAAFVTLYAARSKWWVTDIGRIIMGLCISIAYMTGLSLVRFAVGEFPGEDALRIVGYLAINIGLWHMVWTLVRIQASTSKHLLKRRHRSRTKENA